MMLAQLQPVANGLLIFASVAGISLTLWVWHKIFQNVEAHSKNPKNKK
jgi:hypothetical protein